MLPHTFGAMHPLGGADCHGNGTVMKKMLENRCTAVPAQQGPSPNSPEEEASDKRWSGKVEINWEN